MFVEIQQLTKSFGGTHALRGVSMEIGDGEIHAVCGENGAGKSTLIKCLTGTVLPDLGQVSIDSEPLELGCVATSRRAGVTVIHQESTAFPDLDAVDNIFVGRELRRLGGWLLDRKRMQHEAARLLSRLEQSIPLHVPVRQLSLANRQMICLARALSQNCRLLILDEPTASLSTREAKAILQLCQRLREAGVSILYVSHRLEEVFQIANRVTVLRDGQRIATHDIDQITRAQLVQLMVGREVKRRAAATGVPTNPGLGNDSQLSETPALDVRGLCRRGSFENVSFQVRSREIVGLAGLIGAGRSEVVRAIFGIDDYDLGDVQVEGRSLPKGQPRTSTLRHLGFVPEDRQHQGLVLPMSVKENVSLAELPELTRYGLLSRQQERQLVDQLIEDLQIKTDSMDIAADTLSGGNQQKLVIGKWLATSPRVLMVDEPTRGVDVGAKARVHDLLRELTEAGMATLIVSSDLPELIEVCDRILVMCQGRIAGEVRAADATEESILQLALPLGKPRGANVG